MNPLYQRDGEIDTEKSPTIAIWAKIQPSGGNAYTLEARNVTTIGIVDAYS